MSKLRQLAQLREAAPVVLPSLLLCDFGNLEREVQELEAAGVRGYHLDVMDGHFVPNMSYGLPIVEAMRLLTDLPLDVHLMIANPSQYVQRFAEAGADILTIHAEAVEDPQPVLEEIRKLGVGTGLAINPTTSVEQTATVLPLCDMVLVMSVMPGFGGQEFDRVALAKLRTLRAMLSEKGLSDDVLLEVDGGVNEETISACGEAGAQLLVAGSAIFREPDYAAAVAKLTRLAGANS